MLGDFLSGGVAAGVTDLTPAQAYDLIQQHQDDMDFLIIDVRTPEEYAGGHIEGAINICSTCTTAFVEALAPLDTSATYFVYCGSGFRSASAVAIMEEAGFTTIYNLVDGLHQWTAEGYPIVATSSDV